MSKKFLNPRKLAEEFKKIISEKNLKKCTKFKKVDSCRIKCINCIFKVRFDNCLDVYFNERGGCDIILFFKDKVYLGEVKKGNFNTKDANRALKQILKCCTIIKSLGYHENIGVVIYYGTSKSIVKTNFRREIKNGMGKTVPVKFCKCGDDISK